MRKRAAGFIRGYLDLDQHTHSPWDYSRTRKGLFNNHNQLVNAGTSCVEKSMNNNDDWVLAINGGSSSIKFSIFTLDKNPTCLLTGALEAIGSAASCLSVTYDGSTHNFARAAMDYTTAVNQVAAWLSQFDKKNNIKAIAHRIVYGGNRYYAPQHITTDLVSELRRATELDPDHLPGALLLVETIQSLFPHTPQLACFDTAFHKDMPLVAQLLAIPRRYFDKGIRRHGFHGLSCEYLMNALTELDGNYVSHGRVLLAHLGSGSSVTAVRDGKSIDTSMGLSPCSGLPMGLRSGDLDPGLLWYLGQLEALDAQAFQRMVNHESGLQGISGISGDIRELLKIQTRNNQAAEAVEFYCYQTRKWICAMAGALGGVQTLVFSGGIGENLPEVRARICAHLEFLGVELDAEKNLANNPLISSLKSQVLVRVIHTDEAQMMAQHLAEILTAQKEYQGDCYN